MKEEEPNNFDALRTLRSSPLMVEQSRRRTNQPQVNDFLSFLPIPKAVDPAHIKDLYLNRGLSASQIGEQVGLSKAAVLARLHKMGIRKQTSQGRSPSNYRFPRQVPFGKRIQNGQLVDDRKEMKIARLIVELRQRKGLTWNEVVEKVNRAGHRTKQGLPWKIGTVRMVFKCWADKC